MVELRRYLVLVKQADSFPTPSTAASGLAIISASYGGRAERSRIDVTELLQAKVSNGSLSITAANDVMGRDPAPGVVKTLEVTYRVGDEEEEEYIEVVPETWEMRIGRQEVAEVEEEEVDIIQAVLSDPEEFDQESLTDEYEPASVKTRTSSGGVA